MKFRKDNKILFDQDFALWRGIPSGVDFKIDVLDPGELNPLKLRFILTGKGYGEKDNYGNGSLYPYKLTSKQKQRFLKEFIKQGGTVFKQRVKRRVRIAKVDKKAAESFADFLSPHYKLGEYELHQLAVEFAAHRRKGFFQARKGT